MCQALFYMQRFSSGQSRACLQVWCILVFTCQLGHNCYKELFRVGDTECAKDRCMNKHLRDVTTKAVLYMEKAKQVREGANALACLDGRDSEEARAQMGKIDRRHNQRGCREGEGAIW